MKATPGATEAESWVLPLRGAAGGGVVEQPLPPAGSGEHREVHQRRVGAMAITARGKVTC